MTRPLNGPLGEPHQVCGSPDRPASELRIVDHMPLHAITTIYGERGLRERFASETAKLGAPATRHMINQALQLAGQLHAQDRRQCEPYVNHLLRVALRIIVHYDVQEPDIICAALLHDSVEDHAHDMSAHGRPGAFSMLATTFGVNVAELVRAVTNPVHAPDADGVARYRQHVLASLEEHPKARVIKLSDFTDNGVGLIYTTGPKAVRSARKYAPLAPLLADVIARQDTPLTDRAKTRILGQLATAQQRFAAIAQATAAGRR